MTIGLVGRKSGMTRLFTDDGKSVPVTVVRIDVNRVTQVKTLEVDGYLAIQVTTGSKSRNRINKCEKGHFGSADVGTGLWEFRLEDDKSDFSVGSEITLDLFEHGQSVDVQGTSIGKGYAGGVKRHHFKMQDATHGNSLSHRAPGSIGQCQSPGRVFKGKKMAGHMGSVTRTMKNLTVEKVDNENKLILVKGAVPGSKGGVVIITPAVKKRTKGT